MRMGCFAKAVLTGMVLMISGAFSAAQAVSFVDINNPFIRKIPLAIPVFKADAGDATTPTVARETSDLMTDSLEFSGYFKLLDRGAFLYDPQRSGITLGDVKFQNWTTLGAEMLITGGVWIKGDRLEMDLRLFDTFKARLLVGKQYVGKVADQRRMVHKFCADVIYYLTGSRGVFDTRIAFVSNGTGNKEIYVCEFDGTQPRQFTNYKSITLFPDWSADAKWMAFTSYRLGKPDLYIRNVEHGRGYVVKHKGINITPAWHPKQLALAATLSYSGNQEIYLLTGKGKVTKTLSNGWRTSEVSPSWSPQGDRLAFVSNRSGNPQIYVRDLATGHTQRLTFEGKYNTQPNWSPKGDRIAYAGMQDGRNDIYVIGLDGSQPIRLTFDAGDNEAPSWAPDGSLMVFSSTREGISRIYVMTALGTDQRRLLTLKGQQTNPKWSPELGRD